MIVFSGSAFYILSRVLRDLADYYVALLELFRFRLHGAKVVDLEVSFHAGCVDSVYRVC